jgi:hypothetical protein
LGKSRGVLKWVDHFQNTATLNRVRQKTLAGRTRGDWPYTYAAQFRALEERLAAYAPRAAVLADDDAALHAVETAAARIAELQGICSALRRYVRMSEGQGQMMIEALDTSFISWASLVGGGVDVQF